MNTLTTALINIRRSPYQALTVIIMMTITFVMAYSLSLFLLGSEQVLKYFESRPQVIAFFELDAPIDDINQLAQNLNQKSYVSEIKLVSKQEALEIYQQENQDDPLLLELVTSQILPASIEISGNTINDLSQIKQDLSETKIVEEVILQEDIINTMDSWTKTIRQIGLSATGLLALSSLMLMMVVISMKVATKKPRINIMHLIGATSWFIKSPFVFEGMLYGLISSTLGWAITLGGILYLTPWLKNFLGPVQLFPIPPELFALQYSLGTLVGMLLGSIAGSIAVGRVMKS